MTKNVQIAILKPALLELLVAADQAKIRKHEFFGSRRQSASSGSHTGKATQGHGPITCGPGEALPLLSAELPVLGEGLVWFEKSWRAA